MYFLKKFFTRRQPQPQPPPPPPPRPLPEEISFNLSKNDLNKDDNRNKISYNDNVENNVEISYNYTDSSDLERLTIYSIIIRTKNAMYIYKRNNTPEDRLFYAPEVPDKIPIYLNIEKLDKPIIKINSDQKISDIKVEIINSRFHGGKKSRKRRSQKKKRKSQKSKKLRNQNKSKKRRSQKKKQRKTHRKRK